MSNPIDFKKKIKDINNLKKLLDIIEIQFNKKFNKGELTNFVRFIDQLNLQTIYDPNIDNVNANIVSIYKNMVTQPKTFDMQEYLKNQISETPQNIPNSRYESFNNKEALENPDDSALIQTLINMMPNLNTVEQQISFTKILNYESLLRDSNILLDSRYQNLSNTDRTRIQFTLLQNSKLKTPGSGIVTSLAPVRDILEIEIFPFSIPYSAHADNYYRKITLSILELASISVDTYEDCQYHFMFTATKNKNLIDLVPISPLFRFYKPITNLTNLTLRFGTPLYPITFHNDRLRTTKITYTNPCVLTFESDHNLISGDLVYITDFTSLNVTQDVNIIKSFNDENGFLCSRISHNEISINVNATLVQYPDPNLSINVYFGSKRILLPLRIRYLYNKLE